MTRVSLLGLRTDELHWTLLMISQHWFRWWRGAFRNQALESNVIICYYWNYIYVCICICIYVYEKPNMYYLFSSVECRGWEETYVLEYQFLAYTVIRVAVVRMAQCSTLLGYGSIIRGICVIQDSDIFCQLIAILHVRPVSAFGCDRCE